MQAIYAGLSLAGLWLFLTGLTLFFRRHHYELPEAVVFAVLVLFAVYSAAFQVFFLVGLYRYSFFLDIILNSFSIYYIIKNRAILFHDFHQTLIFWCVHRKLLFPFGGILLYLFLQALLLPPSEYDSMVHNLSRVLLMRQEGSLFLTNYTTFNQVGFLVGADILHFLFLRWPSDWFLGIFSFLSYLSVLLATFSLVRAQSADDRLALLTTLIIASLVELVLQSTSTKNDLPLTAMATASFLAAMRVLSRGDALSLALLGTALALGSDMKAYFLGFSVPFGALLLVAYGPALTQAATTGGRRGWGYLLLPALLLALLVLFLGVNLTNYGTLFGTPANVRWHQNPDGWQGALANACRYFIQILGLPRQLGGAWLEEGVMAQLGPKKEVGLAPQTLHLEERYQITLSLFRPPNEAWSWYGPLAFVLILPALGYALLKGNTFLKITAWSLVLFFAAVCWQIGWMPWNNRFFSLFFGASGLGLGFFLQRVWPRKWDAVWIGLAFLCLGYAALFNYPKPFFDLRQVGLWVHRHLVPFEEMAGKGEGDRRFYRLPIFTWVNLIPQRDMYCWRHYQDERLTVFAREVKPHSRVLMIADDSAWLFPYLVRRPDLIFTVVNPERLKEVGLEPTSNPGHQALLGERFQYVVVANISPPSFLDPARIFFRRDERWRNERGEPGGEAVFFFDYSNPSPGFHRTTRVEEQAAGKREETRGGMMRSLPASGEREI